MNRWGSTFESVGCIDAVASQQVSGDVLHVPRAITPNPCKYVDIDTHS